MDLSFEQFVEKMRQEVRFSGFITHAQLAYIVAKTMKDLDILDKIDCIDVMDAVPCNDVCVVKYTHDTTKKHRYKKLYYFAPSETK